MVCDPSRAGVRKACGRGDFRGQRPLFREEGSCARFPPSAPLRITLIGVSDLGSKERRARYRRLLEQLAVTERLGGVGGRLVLDYGCGAGWFMEPLARRGFRVIGLEVERAWLREAQTAADRWDCLRVLYRGGVLPIKAQCLDLILAVGVIRSLMDRGPLQQAVGEWWRCLRPEGRLLVVETDNAALRRFLSVERIRDVLRLGGFSVVRWYPVRRTSWWGLRLVKAGLLPLLLYRRMAKWELRSLREKDVKPKRKLAYLGEFTKAGS